MKQERVHIFVSDRVTPDLILQNLYVPVDDLGNVHMSTLGKFMFTGY